MTGRLPFGTTFKISALVAKFSRGSRSGSVGSGESQGRVSEETRTSIDHGIGTPFITSDTCSKTVFHVHAASEFARPHDSF